MQILIAEDDPVSLRLLEATLMKWGHQVTAVADGAEAWKVLQSPQPPQLSVLDWMMPNMDGLEVCRRVRLAFHRQPIHIILLTAKGRKEDIIAGLQAGADDYVTKPFDREELRARINVGRRIVELQGQLGVRVKELEASLSREKILAGLLPICCYCKKIRDDKNYWQQVETYVGDHSSAQFTHSICPDCTTKIKTQMKDSKHPSDPVVSESSSKSVVDPAPTKGA